MMKFRTLLNSLKESFKNMVRHPLVALASITTIALMLILLGGFICISLNANHIAESIGKKPPIEIWVKLDAKQDEIKELDQALKNNQMVLEYKLITPQENFQQLKDQLGTEANVLNNFQGESLLPYLFQVRLTNPELTDRFAKQVSGYSGVHKIDYSAEVMKTLSNLIHWINLGTLVVFSILCLIALFIISNLVRISTLARGEEISIMKYVGATNTYIRLPYILEGAIAGLIGSILSIVVVYFGYHELYMKLMAQTSTSSVYALLDIKHIIYPVSIVCIGLGIFIGAIGSFFSVRRYIRV